MNNVITHTSVSKSTPFDNSTNGFTSTNAQDAIEEAKTTAEGKSRFLASCGFDGNSGVGRYLEFSSNVDSNIAGFVLPRAAFLKELSLSHSAVSAVTFQIISWNGSTETVLTTISTTSIQRTASITGLNISVAAGLEIRVKDSAGSCSRPNCYLFFIFQ